MHILMYNDTHRGSYMLYVICILLILFTIIEIYLYEYGKTSDDEKCDFMIVLGAGLYGDRISSALKRRLDQALLYAQKYPDIDIVVSGGQGHNETVSEASAMKKYLVSKGLEESRILLEDKSTSTYTNFLYTKQLLDNQMKKVMITTCDFHMYRSCRIARQIGFIPYRNPAKSTKINCVKYYIRECFCVIKNWILKT